MNQTKTVSKSVINAIEALEDSEFNVLRDERGNILLDVKNAATIWNNFSGTPFGGNINANQLDQFRKDKRSINLVLPEELAKNLQEEGWNVKERETNVPDYPVLHYIKANVTIHHPHNMEEESPFPSALYLVTKFEGKENTELLMDDEISILDGRRMSFSEPIINIEKINLRLRSRKYYPNGNRNMPQKTAVYLANAFVYATEVSPFADPHEAELAKAAIYKF